MSSRKNPRQGRNRQRSLKDILIVDDEESLAFFLQQGLLEIDPAWVVDMANTGEEAVIKINRGIYRLVIADLRMPGLNGLELLQMVRALEPSTEVILMTAYGSDEIAAEAKRLRVFRYVTKPFRIEDMKAWALEALGAKPMAMSSAPASIAKEPSAAVSAAEPSPLAEPAVQPKAEPDVPVETTVSESEPRKAVADESDELAAERSHVANYVAQLRFRTGAMYLFVADMAGQVIAEAGSCRDLDAEAFALQTGKSLAAAICGEQALGGTQRPALLLQRGMRYTACSAAVSPTWMLSIIYDQAIQGRQLEAVLRNMDQAMDALCQMEDSVPSSHVTRSQKPLPVESIVDKKGAVDAAESDGSESLEDLDAILAQADPDPDDEMWSFADKGDEAQWDAGAEGEGFFSLDEAKSLGLVDEELLRKLQGS